MASYLLTWNPKKFDEAEIEALADRIRTEKKVIEPWSCGNTKRIQADARVFLTRLGSEPRGIVCCGWAVGSAYEDKHWSGEGGAATQYVDIEWEWLQTTPLVARDELDFGAFAGATWSPQSSGITIPAEQAFALELLWAERLKTGVSHSPDEVAGEGYTEGAIRLVTVNAYERRPTARRACLAHYGMKCSVCDVTLSERYGPIARTLVHVHHLVPLSSIGEQYVVDPIKHLRPVCPNCHAVLHLRNPPLTIDEGKALIAKHGRAAG